MMGTGGGKAAGFRDGRFPKRRATSADRAAEGDEEPETGSRNRGAPSRGPSEKSADPARQGPDGDARSARAFVRPWAGQGGYPNWRAKGTEEDGGQIRSQVGAEGMRRQDGLFGRAIGPCDRLRAVCRAGVAGQD